MTNAQVSLVSCFGNADGVINLNTSGGNGSYNWNWSGPNGYTSTDDTLTALDTGQYQLSIVDANLCQKDTVFQITQPNTLAITAIINQINCFDDTTEKIYLTISGGTSPFLYDWDLDGLGDNDDDDSLYNLSANDYHVFITDGNNCVVDSLFTLAQPTELTVSASINNNDCATDSLGVIELNTTGGVGGYNFNWSTNYGYASTNDTITQLHSDTFNLSIVDGNLCQLDTLFIVTSLILFLQILH